MRLIVAQKFVICSGVLTMPVSTVQHRKTKKEELEEHAGTIKAKAKRFGNWFGHKANETKDAAADNLSKATVRCPASCYPSRFSHFLHSADSKAQSQPIVVPRASLMPVLAISRLLYASRACIGTAWQGMPIGFLGRSVHTRCSLLPNRGVDADWVLPGLGGDCRQDGGCGAPPGRCC